MAGHWEHFDHQADIGVRGVGDTLAEAFEQAALALVAVIVDPAQVASCRTVSLTCAAPDTELLLVDWLNAVIYAMDAQHMLFHSFRVRISGTQLQASALGSSIQAGQHEYAVEVKGASYAELKVEPAPQGGWLAQCVVDV